MEFVLSGDGGQLRLPVPPSEFTIQSGNLNQTVSVVRQGEINLWGPLRLDGMTIASFFPLQYAPYCRYDGFPSPWECVKTIDGWRESGKPLRIIITDSELGVDINMQVLIEGFEKNMRDCSGDVYFNLTLKKYKVIGQTDTSSQTTYNPTRDTPPGKEGSSLSTALNFFSGSSLSTISYIPKNGEDLWDVAKDKLGFGSAWQTIYKDNISKILDPISDITGINLDIRLPF